MKTNNKAAKKGILRTNPRYSTSSANDDDSNTTGPENSSSSSTRVVRSLADLVRSSAALSAEAAGITQNDVGRVISHKAVSAATAAANHVDDATTIRPDNSNSNNNTMSFDSNSIKEQEEKIMEGMGLSMLQISESGAPYLKTDGSTVSYSSSTSNNAGPAVVDANGNPIAFGIVDEDGQHVKFCEYDNDNDGKENDENISSRERVQHRININSAGDEHAFDDEEEEPMCEFNDSDSDSSDATGDDAILAELGLGELFPIDHDSDCEQDHSEEKRAFLILWQTLSQWLTVETMDLIQGHGTDDDDKKRTQESSAAQSDDASNTVEEVSVERRSVEIGASRRAGITSMIRMHLTRSLAELKRLPLSTQQQKDVLNDQRKIEQRLGDLVGTFDISGPVANFSTKHWKVMTTILIIISFPSLSTDSVMLPSSAQSLGMSAEEYRYLTHSALTSLNNAT
jgi:hypothetical protein